MVTPTLRIGLGYDIHSFGTGRRLVLGGVRIPFARGLVGHSDADVLLHAVCDALLGAAGEGDIGKHFPNTSKQFKNISSLKLLERVKDILAKKKFEIVNIDSTVVLERPKLSKYIPSMRRAIARSLDIRFSQVSVKATTNEGLDAVGTGRGCSAYAVALIHRTGR